MEVLIVHYHLNPGGVSRIIEAQISAIHDAEPSIKIKIIAGKPFNQGYYKNTEIITDPLLYYDAATTGEQLQAKTADIKSLIRRQITSMTIIHGHNMNLGKNPALTFALYDLAAEGIPFVNHCHDFPEDRPGNLEYLTNSSRIMGKYPLKSVLYTNFPNYHYVVLNSCDYQRLQASGIAGERLHLLPNPVLPPPDGYHYNQCRAEVFEILGIDSEKKLITYPVRAIERKNSGEFILFAALFSNSAVFAITQPPLNPTETKQYERWKAFCNKHQINVVFEAGEKVNYNKLITGSDFCMTTSIREGFGMAFLEPWMSGVPVAGRWIDCVCKDLERTGIVFPKFYKKLIVRQNGQPVDFALLPVVEQENFITAIMHNRQMKQDFFTDNPFLEKWLDPVTPDAIHHNRQIIKNYFSIAGYGKELLNIYQSFSA